MSGAEYLIRLPFTTAYTSRFVFHDASLYQRKKGVLDSRSLKNKPRCFKQQRTEKEEDIEKLWFE